MSRPHIEEIRNAGIVGAGGAGFPTHVKLNTDVEIVIANGAECEPLLRVDQQIMAKFSKEVLRGIEIAMEATNAQKGFVGLKKKYKTAISELSSIIKSKYQNIDLFPLNDFYPAGDEFVLVHEVLGRNIPEAGLPLHVGCVVNNVSTLMNISRAVDEGKPVTTRFITITGNVENPKTVEVPIGTTIEDLIKAAGGAKEEPFSVILGGPMMGKVVSDLSKPVTKTDSGLIVLPATHRLIQKKTRTESYDSILTRASCIRCSLCTQVCPRYLLGHRLEPDKVMRAVAYGLTDTNAVIGTFLCTGCGLCTHYGCPMELAPDRVNQEFKSRLIDAKVENPFKHEQIPHPDQEIRKVPIKRLIGRLGLKKYEKDAPLIANKLEVDQVKIPLKQHIGAPTKPIVKKGAYVKCGELIGEVPDNALGAPIHASIDGRVVEVSDYILIHV